MVGITPAQVQVAKQPEVQVAKQPEAANNIVKLDRPAVAPAPEATIKALNAPVVNAAGK